MNNNTPQNKRANLRVPPNSQQVKTPAPKSAPQRVPVQAKAPQRAQNIQNAPQRVNKKTPLQIAKEKEQKAKIAEKRRKEELLKRQYQEQLRIERKRKLQILKSKSINVAKNILFGIITALVIFAVICFAYYRNMSKFTGTANTYRIEFYEYLDKNSEDESTIKKLDARNKGVEAPELVLSEALYVTTDNVYLPYSDIAEYFCFTMSGDNETRTILVGTSQGEYSETNTAVFKIGTKEITLNGSSSNLKSDSFFRNNELYIPIDFFETYVKGIEIQVISGKKQSTASITKTAPEIYFSASSNTPLEMPDVSSITSNAGFTHEYSIDLSEYEQYINPQNPDEYLILVNLDNRLDETYIPDDLTDLIHTRNDREAQQMRLAAAKSLEAFLKAAYANGHSDVTVTSAYRSYAYQSSLFNTRLQQNKITYGEALAEEKTAEFTAYPGSSEHQSGLCCDMHNLPSAMQSFASQEAYTWLYEHAADFGFILRYPKSKEEITGIKFEPWHFRFVGRYHAQRIMESGLCLEEYLANLEE